MDEVKIDCFAYNSTKCKKCTVLKEIRCKDCVFYKTKKQFKADRIKALQKIMSLDKDLKNYIIQKYKIKEGINVGIKN